MHSYDSSHVVEAKPALCTTFREACISTYVAIRAGLLVTNYIENVNL